MTCRLILILNPEQTYCLTVKIKFENLRKKIYTQNPIIQHTTIICFDGLVFIYLSHFWFKFELLITIMIAKLLENLIKTQK